MSRAYDLSADTTQEQLLSLVDELNDDNSVHGFWFSYLYQPILMPTRFWSASALTKIQTASTLSTWVVWHSVCLYCARAHRKA